MFAHLHASIQGAPSEIGSRIGSLSACKTPASSISSADGYPSDPAVPPAFSEIKLLIYNRIVRRPSNLAKVDVGSLSPTILAIRQPLDDRHDAPPPPPR